MFISFWQFRSPTGRLLAWVFLILACCPHPAPARYAFAPEQPVAPFCITEQEGELGTEFYYLSEQEKSGGQSIDFSNRSFEEYLLYRLKGYVYHPRFLEIDSSIKLGLLQQSLSNSGLTNDNLSNGSSSTYLDTYNIFLSFLKEHPLSFSLFANHSRDAVMELFTDRVMTDSQGYGGTVSWKNHLFPMDLTASQTQFKEWGFESFSDSTMKNMDYTVRNAIGKLMNTELHYHYQDYTQSFGADTGQFNIKQLTNLESQDVNLLNTIYLDPSQRSYLSSNLRLFEQSGTQQLTTYYLQERLNLQHTRNFRTYYMFNYLQNRLQEESVDSWRGELGLEHKLFESLESHLDLHWRQSDFAGASERDVGPTARLGYLKQTPWGALSMGYGHTLEQVERAGNSGVRPIRQESLTLHRGVSNFLSNPDVVDSSIRLTGQNGLDTYNEGFDYELLHQGNRVALRMLAGGRISDGQTVLVDYDVAFTSNIHFLSDDQDFNINYDFAKALDGLSLYYRWHDLAARNAPVSDMSILTFTDQLAGMAYHWRGLTWREENEQYQSNFSNYDQLLSQFEGLHEIGSRLHLGWRAGFQATNYQGHDLPPGLNYDNALFAGVTMRGAIRTNGYWEVGAEARQETGQLHETLFGVLGKLGMHWRKTSVELGVRAEQRQRFDDQNDHLGVFLQFSRKF